MRHFPSWTAFWRVFVSVFDKRGGGCADEPSHCEMQARLVRGAGCQRLPEFSYFTPFEPEHITPAHVFQHHIALVHDHSI